MEPSRRSCFQHQVDRSCLTAPRMTILRASSGKGRCGAFASSSISWEAVYKNNAVADSECEEVADLCRDLRRMRLEREVARFEEMDHGTGNIAPERLSTARQEKGIVLSPDR